MGQFQNVGQDVILQRVANPRSLRRLAIGAQVTNLPHILKLTHYSNEGERAHNCRCRKKGVMRHRTSIVAIVLLAASVASAQPDRIVTERAVFFSGEVAMEDGTKPPEAVLIQSVCKSIAKDEAWTDSKGRFSFKVSAGGPDSTSGDSAQATPDKDLSRPIGNSTVYSNPITASLRDCEVQAVLAGFWSQRVSIALKNTLDSTRIGRLILHPMTRGEALTVSATTLAAPSNAKKAYEKGMMAMHDQKWDVASGEFNKAVTAYPKFAAAWFELGVLRQGKNDAAGAIQAWKQALESDAKYVRPYEGLTALAERQQNWADVEKYSRDWILLDAEDFPAAYLYHAVASARLDKAEQAEHSAREGIRLDKDRKIARLSYVLGLILMQKHENIESAKCFRTYLELAPNAKDAPMVREQLAKLEAPASNPAR